MLKQVLAIILSMAMLMTGVSVLAAVDTSTEGITIYTDDFNGFTADETRRDGKNGYPKNAEESDAFVYSSTYSTNYGSSYIKTNAGPDGSTALEVGGRGSDISLMTKGMDTAGSKMYELSYDIKFNKLSAMSLGGRDWFSAVGAVFKLTPEGMVQASADGTNYSDAGTYAADAWYNVKIVVAGTTKQGWLTDASGNTVYSKITEATSTSRLLSALQMSYSVAGSTTGTIDNVAIKEYDLTQIAPAVKSVSISNEVDVPLNTNSATVTFSQPVSGKAKITGGAADIDCTLTLASATPDNYIYTVSWTDALAPETTYTLDLSAVKNAGNLTAASNSNAIFTTVAQAIVTESDSFSTADGSHYQSGTGYISSALIMENWDVGRTSMVTGYTGDALQITTVTEGTEKKMNVLRSRKAYEPTANKSFVLTYRLNMKAFDPEYLCRVYIGVNNSSSGYMASNNALALIIDMDDARYIMSPTASNTTAYKLNADKWYDIIMSLDGTKANISLIDSITGEVLWTGLEKDYANLNTSSYYFVPFYMTCYYEEPFGSINKNQTFLLDDFTIWTVRKDKDLVLSESTVSEPFGLDGKVSLTFNQPVIGTDAMYSLYQGAANNKEAYTDIKINCKDFCTQEISFSDINYQTDYTLDFSGVAAASTAALGESAAASVISFRTEDSPFDAVISGDVNVSGLDKGDTISFNLESKVNGKATIVAALYKDSITEGLVGVAVKDSVPVSEGDSTPVTVTLSENYDANIIKLYVWNGERVKPLMPEYVLKAN